RPAPAADPADYQGGSLEVALQDVASGVIDHFEQKIAEVAVSLIEDPNYRLAGAEEALRQLHAQVEKALQAHEPLTAELRQPAAPREPWPAGLGRRAAAGSQRLRVLAEAGGAAAAAPARKGSFGRKPAPGVPAPAAELLELLRSYPKWRLQSLILQHVTALY